MKYFTMSSEELNCLEIVRRSLDQEITVAVASSPLDLSLRQMTRLRAGFEEVRPTD